MSTPRPSRHVPPRGAFETYRHYIRDLVYGALDGIVTTFAVVAAVTGGALSTNAVLIVGIANLIADGLSMGVGNYLGIRSEESARRREALPELESQPARHGVATLLAFVMAGSVPLLPYLIPGLAEDPFVTATALTLVALFGVGAVRSIVTIEGWLVSGLEMLGLGVLVAAAAYGSGALIASMLH